MGMDIDYIFANQAIYELDQLLNKMNHGERLEISNDIIDFVDEMKVKWGGEDKKEVIEPEEPVKEIIIENTVININEFDKLSETYYQIHKYCSNCGGEDYQLIDDASVDTMNSPIDLNLVQCCRCGYKHIVHTRIEHWEYD